MTTTTDLPDTDLTYSHPDFAGIALRLRGWVQRWEPQLYEVLVEPEDDEPWVDLVENGDGEMVDDPEGGMVRVVMVGDDREHEVHVGDLTPISDDDVCSCGQIGCWDAPRNWR